LLDGWIAAIISIYKQFESGHQKERAMPRSGVPRYSEDEFVRRGETIYESIKTKVDPGNEGRILAIDIESGEYEIDSNSMAASDRLFERLPDPQIYGLRIGYNAVHSFGGPLLKRAS
jgi:hypothetical protein